MDTITNPVGTPDPDYASQEPDGSIFASDEEEEEAVEHACRANHRSRASQQMLCRRMQHATISATLSGSCNKARLKICHRSTNMPKHLSMAHRMRET
eukprot:9475167-Pyramimonas_sp.AAC.1